MPRDCSQGIDSADRAGFEPAVTCATTVFKTVSFDRSDTCPSGVSSRHALYHTTSGSIEPPTECRRILTQTATTYISQDLGSMTSLPPI